MLSLNTDDNTDEIEALKLWSRGKQQFFIYRKIIKNFTEKTYSRTTKKF